MTSRFRIPATGDTLEYLRHLGFRRTIARAAYVALNQVVNADVFGCHFLNAGDENESYLDLGSLGARFLEAEEVIELSYDPSSGLREPSETERALAQGDLCYALLDRGRPVSLNLFSKNGPAHLIDDLYVRFQAPSWYNYGQYTHPDWRGRNLSSVGIIRAFRELQKRGVKRLVATIEWTNYRSLASARRTGWRPCGTLWRLGFAGHSRLGRTRRARRQGMYLERGM